MSGVFLALLFHVIFVMLHLLICLTFDALSFSFSCLFVCSVLVHSGGVHGGHYYAFIRPTLSDQWWEPIQTWQVNMLFKLLQVYWIDYNISKGLPIFFVELFLLCTHFLCIGKRVSDFQVNLSLKIVYSIFDCQMMCINFRSTKHIKKTSFLEFYGFIRNN